MGWSIGYDNNWKRDIGYGVPSICDHPKCNEEIDRGLSFVCGTDPHGGDYGCGLYFCEKHFRSRELPRGSGEYINLCPRCYRYSSPYTPKPDTEEWIRFKLTDISWHKWCLENPEEVLAMKEQIKEKDI